MALEIKLMSSPDVSKIITIIMLNNVRIILLDKWHNHHVWLGIEN